MQQIKWILISLIAFLVSGCGFHMRTLQQLPAPLHRIYLTSNNSNLVLNSEVQSQLAGLGVVFVNQASKAPVTLELSNYQFTHDQPSITTSNQAITYTYTLSINYELRSASNKILLPSRKISIASQQIMNANQIYTNSAGPLIQQRLQKQIADLLYDQLTDKQTAVALASINVNKIK